MANKMRFIPIIIFSIVCYQASAETAVYEFKDKNVELFLACEEEGEEFLIALNRTDSDWKLRFSGDTKTLSFTEEAGPRLYHEDLTASDPYKVEIDLRNPTNPLITTKVIGSTQEIKCKDITNLTQALDDFRTGEFERNRIQELSREISQLKSDRDTQIQALNFRIAELINEITKLNNKQNTEDLDIKKLLKNNGFTQSDKDNLSSELGEALLQQLEPCWGLNTDNKFESVTVSFSLDKAGRVINNEIKLISSEETDGASSRRSFLQAKKTILKCAKKWDGFNLQDFDYEQWREIVITFNPHLTRQN
jgi:hypothetical protein